MTSSKGGARFAHTSTIIVDVSKSLTIIVNDFHEWRPKCGEETNHRSNGQENGYHVAVINVSWVSRSSDELATSADRVVAFRWVMRT
jgi:hypothetical protein